MILFFFPLGRCSLQWIVDNHSNFQLITLDGLSDRSWNLCILITQKSIAQFLPRLDLASYLCFLLFNSFLTTKRHPSNDEPSHILIFRSIQSAVFPVGRATDQSFFMGIIGYKYEGLQFGTCICLWLPCTCAKF